MKKVTIDSPSVLDPSIQKVSYPIESYDLRTELTNLLVEKGFIDAPVPLEKVHLYISKENQRVDENDLNKVSTSFYDTSSKFENTYFNLIKYIAEKILKFDVVFQTTPTVRFNFPQPFTSKHRSKDGVLLIHHTDTMLGHPLEEINFWLPLTECYSTNTLQLSPLDESIDILETLCQDFDFDAHTYHQKGRGIFFEKMLADINFQNKVTKSTSPVEIGFGEILIFDSRCIHTTAENTEKDTRVSLDFRVIPVHLYEAMTECYRGTGRSKRAFVKGDVFFEKTALEL